MKIEFPEHGRLKEHRIENCELKFAVLKVVKETANKVLIIFPERLGHKFTISNWIQEHTDQNPEFLGAGFANISNEMAVWGADSCARPKNEGGFGKDKPEQPEDADKLLVQVRDAITKIAKTLQEV